MTGWARQAAGESSSSQAAAVAFEVDGEVGGGGVMGMGQLLKAQRRSRFIKERATHEHNKTKAASRPLKQKPLSTHGHVPLSVRVTACLSGGVAAPHAALDALKMFPSRNAQ